MRLTERVTMRQPGVHLMYGNDSVRAERDRNTKELDNSVQGSLNCDRLGHKRTTTLDIPQSIHVIFNRKSYTTKYMTFY